MRLNRRRFFVVLPRPHTLAAVVTLEADLRKGASCFVRYLVSNVIHTPTPSEVSAGANRCRRCFMWHRLRGALRCCGGVFLLVGKKRGCSWLRNPEFMCSAPFSHCTILWVPSAFLFLSFPHVSLLSLTLPLLSWAFFCFSSPPARLCVFSVPCWTQPCRDSSA